MQHLHPSVVLVNPPAQVVREARYDTPSFPAIGIAYIANYLHEHGGIKPLVIDARLERRKEQEVIDQIAALQPAIVGFSAMTHMVTTSARMAAAIKARSPRTIAVLGGFHATFLPARTLKEFPVFDFLVVGEGEMAFLKLVQSVLSGGPLPEIKGVWFTREDGTAAEMGRAETPSTLDELGDPGWHLFDRKAMDEHCTLIPIMAQRGCPFSCNFCSRPYGQKVRRRTAECVVDEMERSVNDYGVRDFLFFDETFTVNKKFTLDICKEIVRRGLKVTWWAHAHANTLDLELVKAMKAAGCREVGMGVESGNDDIMAAMKKGVTKAGLIRAVTALKEGGLPGSANIIIGHPNETVKTAWESIRFLAKLNPVEPVIGIMVPYPGTEIWEMAIRGQGGYVKMSDNWDDYNKQLGNAVSLEKMSRRTMERMQAFGYVYIFLRNGRLGDMIRTIAKNQTLVMNMLRKLVFLPPVASPAPR
jgi:radical SAM superfamily enzyme YgiQ (UPF0313 family)